MNSYNGVLSTPLTSANVLDALIIHAYHPKFSIPLLLIDFTFALLFFPAKRLLYAACMYVCVEPSKKKPRTQYP